MAAMIRTSLPLCWLLYIDVTILSHKQGSDTANSKFSYSLAYDKVIGMKVAQTSNTLSHCGGYFSFSLVSTMVHCVFFFVCR